VAEAAFTAAGFQDVTVETVPSPLHMKSPAECLRFERESFGALHQMLTGLSPAEQEAAWAEAGRAPAEFGGPDGLVAPCAMLVRDRGRGSVLVRAVLVRALLRGHLREAWRTLDGASARTLGSASGTAT